MNNTDKLLKEMKDWLKVDPSDNTVTISECFREANQLDKWRVDMFYTTFAPYMANILDDLKVKDNESLVQARLAALKSEIKDLLESERKPLTVNGKQLVNIGSKIGYGGYLLGDLIRDVNIGDCIVCKVDGDKMLVAMVGDDE